MSEPDYPYEKKPKPNEINQTVVIPPPPDYPPSPPSPPPPPMDTIQQNKFTCDTCGKTFTTKEELTMHMETAHQSPKKQV